MKYFFGFFVFVSFISCKSDVPPSNPSAADQVKTTPVKPQPSVTTPTPKTLEYPFRQSTAPRLNLTDLVSVPDGYRRVKVEKGSFQEWLRFLPTKELSEDVHLYNGTPKSNQNVHYAILDIDVGKRDLQQCADAVMRLRAEYLYSKKDYKNIHFNFTSGHKVGFEDWSRGRKPKVIGNGVTFTNSGDRPDTSYANFRKYMERIFSYAGTASLSKEMNSISINDLRAGDVFIQGGFPGHAVIVIDMAQNETGKKIFLLAQSYMPAQDIHILKNYNDDELSPWYSTNFGTDLATPEWGFKASDLKRF